MTRCINIKNSEFKSLIEKSGLSSLALEAKMNVWMNKNNTDV
jgi:hypothetical protein